MTASAAFWKGWRLPKKEVSARDLRKEALQQQRPTEKAGSAPQPREPKCQWDARPHPSPLPPERVKAPPSATWYRFRLRQGFGGTSGRGGEATNRLAVTRRRSSGTSLQLECTEAAKNRLTPLNAAYFFEMR